MKTESEILFEWDKPREIIEYEVDMFRQRGPKISLYVSTIVFMIIISLLIPILLILQRCEIGSLYFFAIFFAAGILVPAAWLIFLFIIIPTYYSKNLKMTYQITSAAFISKTDKKLRFKWNEFTGFWVSEHERCKGRKILNLYYRKFKKTIALPDNNMADSIVAFVSNNLTEITDDSMRRSISLTFKQNSFLAVISMLYSFLICVSLFFGGLFVSTEGIFGFIVLTSMCITLYAGLGTLGMYLLYHKLIFKRKDLTQIAMIYNGLAFIGILCVSLMAMLIHFYLELSKAPTV
ncbi:MAG: hypothetical protein ACYTGA_12685 [Planctomycetota bacterium]|jgi:hypothetical protein